VSLFRNSSLVAIEDAGHLLERMAVGFGVEEPHCASDDHEDHAIHDIVFPRNCFQCDGVDEYVEEEGQLGSDQGRCETPRAEVVRPDLARIRDKERSECDIVESVVYEEEWDDGNTSCSFGSVCERAGQAGDDHIRGQHTKARGHKELAAAQSIDGKGGRYGHDEIPDLKEARDHGLTGDRGYAYTLQDRSKVVGGDSNAVPLREHTKCDCDECSVTVALRPEHVGVGSCFSKLCFQGKGFGDFLELELGQCRAVVTPSVVFDKEGSGFFYATL
jgi:hypothetical protein